MVPYGRSGGGGGCDPVGFLGVDDGGSYVYFFVFLRGGIVGWRKVRGGGMRGRMRTQEKLAGMEFPGNDATRSYNESPETSLIPQASIFGNGVQSGTGHKAEDTLPPSRAKVQT